jgi:poly-gamma-glutamate synthesis protein (capsule biosynthesis protein)
MAQQKHVTHESKQKAGIDSSEHLITLFLCGDVMTGRGIDQILPYPNSPEIYESYLRDARDYIQIAEIINGPIARPVSFDYIWGDALTEFTRFAPDLRIINLETSITSNDRYWKGKGINYRMHPRNIRCLSVAGIDGVTLANNHVLDWDYAGLEETLATLQQAHIKTAGAGANIREAQAPAVFEIPGKGRVLLFSFCDDSSGVPSNWQASRGKPGVYLLPDLSPATVREIAAQINSLRQKNDIIIASIHWGGNWGYRIAADHARFAHALIDKADVDIIHGHSSHHPKGIEIYRDRPVIYGCGDFINDYEGIRGHEDYRGDLSLMYFVTMNTNSGELVRFEMAPMQMKHFRVNHANKADAKWLTEMLNTEGSKLNTSAQLLDNRKIRLSW